MSTGHYSCGLPWVQGRAAAAENLDVKVSRWNEIDRLTKLSKRLDKDQGMKTAVFDLVKGISDEGHAKLVDNPEVPPGTPRFYLPIHVDKKNAQSTGFVRTGLPKSEATA
jgi:hypothetical protein